MKRNEKTGPKYKNTKRNIIKEGYNNFTTTVILLF